MRSTWATRRRVLSAAAGAVALLGVVGGLVACSSGGDIVAMPSYSPFPQPSLPAGPVAVPARSFTLLGAGDVLLHDPFWSQAQAAAQPGDPDGFDFTPLFASAIPAISGADLAICHLETPVAPAAGPFTNYPIFSVPPQIATDLATIGYDSCSTASNHSIDDGYAGIVRTLDALDAAGIKHAGTARTPAEHATINMIQVGKNIKVAQLSYAFDFNGLTRPAGMEWEANKIDVPTILAEARQAKLEGANVVVVSVHAGTEYDHNPNSQQLDVDQQLLASPDIDLVLGHHAHVVQPMEKIGDKWVAYGHGNQVAWQQFSNDTRDGLMTRFTFTEVSPGHFQVTLAEALPTFMWLDGGPGKLYDIAAALADPTTPDAVRSELLASLRRTHDVLGERGAFDAGLVMAGASYLS